eukprot:Sspe_Gene.81850::Locus_53032_Transcript_1_1_Confidence_1.000_Length_4922::g.81850::m.81850
MVKIFRASERSAGFPTPEESDPLPKEIRLSIRASERSTNADIGNFRRPFRGDKRKWDSPSSQRNNANKNFANDQCFRCGKRGHWSKECNSPPNGGKGNNKRNDRNDRAQRNENGNNSGNVPPNSA